MQPRDYQQDSIDTLYSWWVANPGADNNPILVQPPGAGKSVVIAELTRLLWDTWPDDHPRTLVVVPSKELAEQNGDKLRRVLPAHLSLGYYSASLGKKQADADVIVATIGSVCRNAHLLGNIRCVIVDECHLISPHGSGMYRQLLDDLAKTCAFRVVGLTATPFRGDGVWLTDGKAPLFTGIAHAVQIGDLLERGHLAPLVRPKDDIKTSIDASGISTKTGDYNLGDLADRVDKYLADAADEAVTLAADRRKWIAFLPTVKNADTFCSMLCGLGVQAAVVCGETPTKDRERLVGDFRSGRLRCLVTVLALATGFDVPDVDCIVWLRPTISPVLYVQGAGRGLRPADGKTDCLWLDFSDTTERMGPIDTIRGRKKSKSNPDQGAPFAICGECGSQVRPASLLECPECGNPLRDPTVKDSRHASNSAILAGQLKFVTYDITRVSCHPHHKPGKPPSVRVDYFAGLRRVATEWVCPEHLGFAGEKARQWTLRRGGHAANTAAGLISQASALLVPDMITVNEAGKYPEIVEYHWEPTA